MCYSHRRFDADSLGSSGAGGFHRAVPAGSDDDELGDIVLSVLANRFGNLVSEQRLTDGCLVRDNVEIGITSPRAQDGVSSLRCLFSIAQG